MEALRLRMEAGCCTCGGDEKGEGGMAGWPGEGTSFSQRSPLLAVCELAGDCGEESAGKARGDGSNLRELTVDAGKDKAQVGEHMPS